MTHAWICGAQSLPCRKSVGTSAWHLSAVNCTLHFPNLDLIMRRKTEIITNTGVLQAEFTDVTCSTARSSTVRRLVIATLSIFFCFYEISPPVVLIGSRVFYDGHPEKSIWKGECLHSAHCLGFLRFSPSVSNCPLIMILYGRNCSQDNTWKPFAELPYAANGIGVAAVYDTSYG